MEFSILGPLRVAGPDGLVELGAPKQRAVLAMLLLAHRDEAVPVTRLIDGLWDQEPPATANKGLQIIVSQLRRAVGAESIVTRP
jgi:DNA-binding SARP family transcriptional activator